ncbi:hypothetical protein [Terasakiella pusilla]|uniref:hypothetical protein n=1 Tax=Terasakiella pusilla TaxID=64973 RepID=UPI003AA94FBE
MSDTSNLEARVKKLESVVKYLREDLDDVMEQASSVHAIVLLLLAYNSKGTTLTLQEYCKVAPELFDFKFPEGKETLTAIEKHVFETLLELDQIQGPQDTP